MILLTLRKSVFIGFACVHRNCLGKDAPLYGCDCYAYALLASGFVDLVIESGLKPYDFLALVPVIAGAGGTITDWSGNPLLWKASSSAFASSFNVVAAGDSDNHQQALESLEWQRKGFAAIQQTPSPSLSSMVQYIEAKDDIQVSAPAKYELVLRCFYCLKHRTQDTRTRYHLIKSGYFLFTHFPHWLLVYWYLLNFHTCKSHNFRIPGWG